MGSVGNSLISEGKHDITIGDGYLRYEVERPYTPDNPVIFVHGMVVEEGSRQQGTGTKLINEVKGISDKTGLPVELFAVPIRNSTMTEKELIAWYEKRGFKVIDGDNLLRYTPKK